MPTGNPACCRAVGLRSSDDLATVTVFVPVATSRGNDGQRGDAPAGWRSSPRIPISHCATQLKGIVQATRAASDDEEGFVREHFGGFGGVLNAIGISGPRDDGRSCNGLRLRSKCGSKKSTSSRQDRRPAHACDEPTVRLSDLTHCFQGVTPSLIATVDGRGVPNITYVSQVYYLDEHHVALSCQFFNKTRRNLDENPRACVEMIDPLTLQAYRMRLKFLRSEKERSALRHDVGADRGHRVGDRDERHLSS